uniref:Membralin n=1 Tax=Acrobeloides nanus TaxID=290746 RepID=A0A914C2P6_9BILA
MAEDGRNRGFGGIGLDDETLAGLNINANNLNNNNRFGVIRDRLFQAMLVKVAISYSRHFSFTMRRIIEFIVFIVALSLLATLIYVHIMFNRVPSSCLMNFKDSWPRKGVLRVEVISNLAEFQAREQKLAQEAYLQMQKSTHFRLKDILIHGPIALPPILKRKSKLLTLIKNQNQSEPEISPFSNNLIHELSHSLISFFLKPVGPQANRRIAPEDYEEYDDLELLDEFDEDDLENEGQKNEEYVRPGYVYIVEYSLHYGLLRLKPHLRQEFGIPTMLIRLDAETDKCFGDWKNRFMMRYLVGYEDIIMSSVKALAENETDKGYLRDIINDEHYHFVSVAMTRASYLTALFVMLIFTFAISMLLRFSHHQIFLFIVDLLQMFELNQPLVFPIAPLLTVILALVGMEAIMSEIFNDTSTAFYVILLVWVADQYDAICCHSPVAKRHWLRFFYLYHFAFYAYQYRFNGQYSGLALLTSTFFILHSMIFFFHHYEMPLILYQDRLQRVVHELQHTAVSLPNTPVNIRISTNLGRAATRTISNTSTMRASETSTDSSFTPLSTSASSDQSSTSSSFSDVSGSPDSSQENPRNVPIVADPATVQAGEALAEEIINQTMSELFEMNIMYRDGHGDSTSS